MKKSMFALYYRSFFYMGPARKRYLLGLALGAFELAILFSMPYINQELIDIVTGASQGDIMATLFWMLAVFLLFVPPVVYGKYLQAISAAQGTVRLRKLLFGHILHMPNGAMARYKTGDYITRLTSDAEGAMAVFNTFLVVNLIRFAVIFPITLVMLLMGDWHIAVAGVLYSGINMGLSLYLNPLAKRLERGAKEEIAGSASFLIEALRSIPVIRVFALQAALAGRYRAACGVIREKRMKSQTVMGITYGTVDFFAQSAQAVGFILGIVLAGSQVTLGKAVFHATLMSMMADSVFRLSTFLLLSQSRLVAMERVFKLLDEPLEDLEEGSREIGRDGDIAVEFRDVGFSYGIGMREAGEAGEGKAEAGAKVAGTTGAGARAAGTTGAGAKAAGMSKAVTEAGTKRDGRAGTVTKGDGPAESGAYEPRQNVLEHLNLVLHRGEHLAIVGGSGGGKSTVIKLMEGFYAPTDGNIYYFGQDSAGLSLAAIRELFAYVPQECTLFDGTLRENIALGRPEASQAQIEEAAKMADIHDFIVSLPRGYESQAGEQGGQLSGGQKQRIAIARAILKGAPILLLDEATAALDSGAEREVQQCLDRLAHSLTTVTVAHRLSTIRNADRILVMEGGRIVEEGDFDGLLERRGRFWELYESQRRGSVDGKE
ncbi:ABC transporter ATP-binding protein [uncultured Acetatifactor sp.]|uniref:ABC transporter ATP-binding protein n=1 Tax=uncultured Acetatifactor sp. TaxID=1671927 RepID=UPI0027297FB2|nr:ABC transporter ATP-binding protein [uncultured Acetatifactor sp.]